MFRKKQIPRAKKKQQHQPTHPPNKTNKQENYEFVNLRSSTKRVTLTGSSNFLKPLGEIHNPQNDDLRCLVVWEVRKVTGDALLFVKLLVCSNKNAYNFIGLDGLRLGPAKNIATVDSEVKVNSNRVPFNRFIKTNRDGSHTFQYHPNKGHYLQYYSVSQNASDHQSHSQQETGQKKHPHQLKKCTLTSQPVRFFRLFSLGWVHLHFEDKMVEPQIWAALLSEPFLDQPQPTSFVFDQVRSRHVFYLSLHCPLQKHAELLMIFLSFLCASTVEKYKSQIGSCIWLVWGRKSKIDILTKCEYLGKIYVVGRKLLATLHFLEGHVHFISLRK